jgi:hypothetical protein
MDEKS